MIAVVGVEQYWVGGVGVLGTSDTGPAASICGGSRLHYLGRHNLPYTQTYTHVHGTDKNSTDTDTVRHDD